MKSFFFFLHGNLPKTFSPAGHISAGSIDKIGMLFIKGVNVFSKHRSTVFPLNRSSWAWAASIAIGIDLDV